ncbi:MAG: extracellular solute-binding protein, partial [Oscillospiraceae bacterium]|nr:extracellular solute-binding protein [Oscillospiraceae bacterium]
GSSVENPSDSDANTTETTTAEIDYMETLPVINYEGYTFKVIGYHIPDRVTFPADEENGEPLNDALFRRNRFVEERYNINFVNVPFPDRPSVVAAVRKSIQAQDNAYDIILTSLGDGLNLLAPEGNLYDLNSIGYLQLDSAWWCKYVYEDFQVNDKIFYSTGPIVPFFYFTPCTVMYNKKLASDLNIGDLNKLVFNNEWTADKFLSIIKDQNRDLDGDGVMTKENDFFGLASDPAAATAFIAGFGQKMTVRDKDTFFKLNYESQSMVNAIEKAKEIILEPASTFNGALTGFRQYDEWTPFLENRILFMIGSTAVPSLTLRNMESDFGVLPFPKWNAAQENYYSDGIPFGPTGAGVPSYCDNPERTGLIMETMAYVSYELVRPAMYDNILYQKSTRDAESQQMLDLIFSGLSFDLNVMHNFGGSYTLIRTIVNEGKGDFVSGYAAIKDKAEAEIQVLIDAYMQVS